MTAKAESIVRTTGYGAHVAWIPFYLNDPENKTENINIKKNFLQKLFKKFKDGSENG